MPDADLPASLPIPRAAVPALALAAFCSGVSLRVTDALLPLFAHDFSTSLGRAAAVITAFSIAYGVSQLFFGPVGDRFGKYRVIAWGCAACALTASACGLAPDFPLLVTVSLLYTSDAADDWKGG